MMLWHSITFISMNAFISLISLKMKLITVLKVEGLHQTITPSPHIYTERLQTRSYDNRYDFQFPIASTHTLCFIVLRLHISIDTLSSCMFTLSNK